MPSGQQIIFFLFQNKIVFQYGHTNNHIYQPKASPKSVTQKILNLIKKNTCWVGPTKLNLIKNTCWVGPAQSGTLQSFPLDGCLSSSNLKLGCSKIATPSQVASSIGRFFHFTKYFGMILFHSRFSLTSSIISSSRMSFPSLPSGDNSSLF